MINSIHMAVGGAGAKVYNPTPDDFEQLEKWKAGIIPARNPNIEKGIIIPKYNMCYNWASLESWTTLLNFLNKQSNIYYLVFCPKNKRYDPKKNLVDHVRKKCGKFNAIIITREIEATKIHYNVLVQSDEDLMKLADTQDSRFFIKAQKVKPSPIDIKRVHEYIIWEAKFRYFYNNKDIYTKIRNP